ncbi:FAD-dependent monooxygenase [Actinomadura nitritigenes]|uniref:FAD-dependent monooxygenase n=1 Tax=Actinomadura nitritigenes TaxID=134602 RepID=UPI003D8DF146
MSRRRVAVIGGGPAGLYAARLLKVARPDWAVTVHERMRGSRDTFGFGVVLTGSTMSNLRAADPATADDIHGAAHTGHTLRLLHGEQAVELHGARNLTIARSALLEVLARHARAAGVILRTGAHTAAAELDADVIIAADGARSATREKLATELGAQVDIGRGLYIWCGADVALPHSTFASARTGHGVFVAHAYPYAADRSTFLIEADQSSLRAAGMTTEDGGLAPDGSDEHSLRYLQRAFTGLLSGHRLLGNRSRWLRFPTVHLRRWSHGNVVLIGDAAHTAHYTLGSGTKLAMEDAIALSRALLAEPDPATAFAEYEKSRRESVHRFQALAARSQRWWESFPLRERYRPAETLALGFLTRAGNITLDHLAAGGRQPLLDALNQYAGTAMDRLPPDPVDWTLSRPAVPAGPVTSSIAWSDPDPWSGPADAVVARLRTAPPDAIRLHGGDGRRAVQGRIDLAERLKLELGRTVTVEVPGSARAEAAAALVCGRVDRVHLT